LLIILSEKRVAYQEKDEAGGCEMIEIGVGA
jgi:hypothetical protein